VWDLLRSLWWGVIGGIIAVGFMTRVPREYFNALLGRGDTFGGLIRAAIAGLLLDMCSHGILMIAAKMYERGASLGQVMTFLIASPWNSFSLTLILISMIGLKWTLLFILGSVIVALGTGWAYQILVAKGSLPQNPNSFTLPENFRVLADAKSRLSKFRPGPRFLFEVCRDGMHESMMVIRWLLLGIILAALIRAFVGQDIMNDYFGPTVLGLLLTLLATAIVEVCSEGSTPIGADLVTRAHAPGNGFTFLMGGISTNYTGFMVIRQFTQSWKAAIFLPLISIPQILLLGWLMNQL
jgi:uncharacterized membrane protein YraQ (UPF0718 family)